MPEGKTTTETINRAEASRYLPLDFAQKAPTDQGPDVLMEWLDENPPKAVKQEVEAQKARLPEVKSVNGSVEGVIEELYKDRLRSIVKPLWRYANYHHHIHQARERPEQDPKMPEAVRKTPEQYRQRQMGVESVLYELSLTDEKEIIDDLFKQAEAGPGSASTGLIVEGQVSKRS